MSVKRFLVPDPLITRDLKECVRASDYDLLAAELTAVKKREQETVNQLIDKTALLASFEQAERDDEQTMKERDYNAEMADKLAAAISTLTGVDIGEHSNLNCPWHAALEAAEDATGTLRNDIQAAYNGLDHLTHLRVAFAADPNDGRRLAIDAAEIKGRLATHMRRIDAALAADSGDERDE